MHEEEGQAAPEGAAEESATVESKMEAFLSEKHADSPPAPEEEDGSDVEDADDLEPEEAGDDGDLEDEDGEEEEAEEEEEQGQPKLTRTKRLANQRDEAREQADEAGSRLVDAVEIAKNAHEQSQLAHEDAVLYKAEADDWKDLALSYRGMLTEQTGYEPHPSELENFTIRQQLRRAKLEGGRVQGRMEAESRATVERETQERLTVLQSGVNELSQKYGVDYIGLLRAASMEGVSDLAGIEAIAKSVSPKKARASPQRDRNKNAVKSSRLKGGRGRTRAPRSSDPDEARTQEMEAHLTDRMARGGRLN